MALIPDSAIDRFTELSKGARLLYVFLCRCRNQKTGRCFPSVATTQEALGIKRSAVYGFRKELSSKGWATFEGDDVKCLLGFSPETWTVGVENKADKPSPEIRTTFVDTIEDKPSPETWTKAESRNVDSKVQDPGLLYKEQPAKLTSKEEYIHVQSGQVREIFAYWQFKLSKQKSKLTSDRETKIKARLNDGYTVEQIKQGIDGCQAYAYVNDQGTVFDDIELICRSGSKLENFIQRGNGNGKGNQTKQPGHRETHNEREARKTLELLRSIGQQGREDNHTDPDDSEAAGITIDISRR